MDPSGNLSTQILLILVLTFINAIFSASEIAFVSLNQQKMTQLAESQRVMKLLDKSDDFLATIQVAITLAGFFSSASAATTFADRIMTWLPSLPGGKQSRF